MAPSTPKVSAEDELETYMLMLNNSSDVLRFWKEHEWQMAGIARQLLSVPATSTSSVRDFSVCGAVVTERRCRLTAANLEKLVFLKNNMTDILWLNYHDITGYITCMAR